jgi:hypothetical protein
MFTDYVEFEIDIQPRNGDVYPLSVTSPGGEVRGTLRLPTADPSYKALADRLDALDADEELLARLGRMLFEALFQDQIKAVYTRSQGLLRGGQGLRIKLRLAQDAGDVAALPWELLYDPDHGPLTLLDAPVVRYLPQPVRIPSLRAELPLRVLLTAAQTPPAGDVARELGQVQEALASLGNRVRVAVEPHLTPARFQRLLREGFHIWHFVGRATLSADGKAGQLLFRGASSAAEPVSAAQLGIMLHRSGVRLAVLDACESTRLAAGPLHGIAPALIRAQIPAVVALQFTAPEQCASPFVAEFYRALAEGFPIDACATEGRKAVMGAAGLGRPDWATPTVYTRAPDGRLFDLPPIADIPGAIAAPLGEGFARVSVSSVAGTLLHNARPPSIARLDQRPRAPRAPRSFRDREEEQEALLPEIEPGRGAWLRGPAGAGRSALLRLAANSEAARALPDGVLYINEQLEPSEIDDIAQGLFNRFYAGDTAVQLTPEAARTYLGDLRALFILDRLPLNADRLADLADLLAGGAVLIAADGAAPDTLLELPLGGLPRGEAIGLCAAEARLAESVPQIASLLDQLCVALNDLPLPLLLACRLVRLRLATLDQLVAVLDDMTDEPEPLARAARLALIPLSEAERAVLGALTRMGGTDADLKAIEAVSQAPPASLVPALERLCDLRLVEGGGDRYAIATLALQRILDRLLKPGPERKRAAAYFAGAALLHVGDLAWLETEFANLTAAIKTALESGEVAQAGALTRALQPLLTLRGYWAGWGQAIDWAELAARAGGDRALEAWALHERGTRAGLLGDGATAALNLDRARRRREALGDSAGAAASERNMAYLGLIAPTSPARPQPSSKLKWIFAAALLLVAIGGGWLALAPLLASTPPTPAPTTQPTAIAGVVAPATPETPTPDDPSPTALPATAAPVAVVSSTTPTPTRSATSTPATPTATPLPTCRVIDQPVNLRGGPGTAYPLLTDSLAGGSVLEPLARNSAGSWLNIRVQATSRRGWVIANPELIACTIPVEELPVVAAPPLPPPRPTATPTPIPTETAAPTALPEVIAPPTATAVPPTAAPPTPTAMPQPTDTPAPPTDTPLPTDTPEPTLPPPTATPTATATPTPRPVPPTDTPEPCSTCPTATPN